MKNPTHRLLVLSLVLTLAGCGQKPAEKQPEKGDSQTSAPINRVQMAPEIAMQSGVKTAPAAAGVIRDEHDVQGLMVPVEGRNARIVARFPGPVRAIHVAVGDRVKAGQRLATIESNVSLSDYEVTAPLSGTVLSRNAAVGDLAGETPLFEIADLSRLWVDIHLFGGDAEHIHAGLPVEVVRLSDGVRAMTTLDRVLPGMATASQSTVARAVVINSDGNWRPGASVRVRVVVAEDQVTCLVPLEAVQALRGADVVFVRTGQAYEARPVKLGRRDGKHVEIVAGIDAGTEIVVEQSYLIKADLEKSSVEDSD